FLAVVVAPTVLAAVYFGFIATPQYESTSLFTIQSADMAAGLPAMMGLLPGSGAARDSVVVREYVLSRDMLDLLVRDHGFLEHYRQARIDWLSRLGESAPSEDIYEYYLGRVEVVHDELGSVLTLKVRAFSSADAKRFSEAILLAAEAKVNAMDEEARGDTIALAQREVDRAEGRLVEARQKVLELQRDGHELNPLESAGTLMAVRGGLEGELAAARAALQALMGSMQPSAPQVIAQRQRVAALAGQVEAQRRRMTGAREGALGESIAEFEPVIVEKELAQHAYQSAYSALEMARVDASRQHRYLVTIASPSAPDAATHPVTWKGVLVTFLGTFALLGIGALLVASVREHANI
ncbi:MAG: hypothetical protein H5U40_14480, partial [Polyangiaceae bacterium]|nr:hypothetical protein [Polyangiaceae bacterium]